MIRERQHEPAVPQYQRPVQVRQRLGWAGCSGVPDEHHRGYPVRVDEYGHHRHRRPEYWRDGELDRRIWHSSDQRHLLPARIWIIPNLAPWRCSSAPRLLRRRRSLFPPPFCSLFQRRQTISESGVDIRHSWISHGRQSQPTADVHSARSRQSIYLVLQREQQVGNLQVSGTGRVNARPYFFAICTNSSFGSSFFGGRSNFLGSFEK